MSRRNTAYLYMLLVSVIWGAAPAVIKFTLHDFPPLIFLTYRFFISSVVGIIWIAATGQKLPTKPRQWNDVFWYSFIGLTVALGLLFFGFDKTTSLTGNILTSLGPLAIVVASEIFLHEHVTKSEWRGITIALIGTLFIVLSPLFNGGLAHILGALEGNLLIMAAMAADAVAIILAKVSERSHIGATMLAHLSFIVALLTIAPLALAVHGGGEIITTILNAPLRAHLGVWFMALASGTLAYSLRNRAVQAIEVSETAPFAYLFPIWGAPLSILWLGEKLTPPFIIGAIIITIGVVIAEYKHRRRKNKSH